VATPYNTGGSVTVLSVIDAWRRAMPVMLRMWGVQHSPVSKDAGKAINERGRPLRQPQYATRYLQTQLSLQRCVVFLGRRTVPITVSPVNTARVTAQKLIDMVYS